MTITFAANVTLKLKGVWILKRHFMTWSFWWKKSNHLSEGYLLGPGRINQLGGFYVNGKPLPKDIREQIINLARIGVRPCDISRQLKITHGCISKLLSKYQKTGSINPGGTNVGRPKVITPRIEQTIDQYRREQPGIFSWELRDRLLRENVCSRERLPSLSSISRLIKRKMMTGSKNTGFKEENVNRTFLVGQKEEEEKKELKLRDKQGRMVGNLQSGGDVFFTIGRAYDFFCLSHGLRENFVQRVYRYMFAFSLSLFPLYVCTTAGNYKRVLLLTW